MLPLLMEDARGRWEFIRVRLDGTDNGRYMTINSEQPLSLKMSRLDGSHYRHLTAIIDNGHL
jgi:hypothetical protein